MVDGAYLVLDSYGGNLYQLNATASFIWGILWKYSSIDAIVKRMVDEFDVDVKTATKDVSGFLKTSLKRKLLVASAP